MKVLVYGSLNIDLIFSVDHVVRPGETISGKSLTKSAGGKGANQAAALAKAGLRVYAAGKIGADGRFLTGLLQSYGVNTEGIVEYKGDTGQAIIQLDKNRQNSIIVYSGGNGAITTEEITRTLAGFGPGDCILLQNEIVLLKEAITGAKRRGLAVYFNPSPYDRSIEELPLDMVDMFFVNEIEGAALAAPPEPGKDGADTPPEILDRLVNRFPDAEIILTVGEKGAYYGRGEIREKADAPDVEVADTVGAGDTFTGYFIAARARRFPVSRALAAACKAAAISVSRPGAMEAIPLAGEVFNS
ncbi:MAG: ribokinase [Treponema sp.]|jgi:ribokinase|nr:ribokinase [Treponema sp.]